MRAVVLPIALVLVAVRIHAHALTARTIGTPVTGVLVSVSECVASVAVIRAMLYAAPCVVDKVLPVDSAKPPAQGLGTLALATGMFKWKGLNMLVGPVNIRRKHR